MTPLDELIALVSGMRKWQKDYFKSRTVFALDEAKKREAAVDAWLKKHNDKQTGLFEDAKS